MNALAMKQDFSITPWDNVRGAQIGPWWFRLHIGPYFNGWSFYVFRHRVAWRPIDYTQTAVFNGKRQWGYPRITALDLRR